MPRPTNTLERIINLLTVIAGILAVTLITHRLVSEWGTNSSPPANNLLIGSNVKLDRVNWAENGSTLLMVLDVNCRFCRQSGDFYRRLAEVVTNKSRLVAVLPEPISESRAYLENLGVIIPNVRQANFQQLGVVATPTLILIDGMGRIQTTWVGKLNGSQEQDVIHQVNGPQDVNADHHEFGFLSPDEFARVLRKRGDVPLLDVRTRTEYSYGHIKGALNIPWDELEARAPHEVPRDSTVMIYCSFCLPCEKSAHAQGTATLCTEVGSELRGMGFSQLRFIDGDLQKLKDSGVPVDGHTLSTRVKF